MLRVELSSGHLARILHSSCPGYCIMLLTCWATSVQNQPLQLLSMLSDAGRSLSFGSSSGFRIRKVSASCRAQSRLIQTYQQARPVPSTDAFEDDLFVLQLVTRSE